MSFDIALSGLDATNTQLNTISNNIANVSTSGFKESRTEFSAVYNGMQPSGVEVAAISQNFSKNGPVNGTVKFLLCAGPCNTPPDVIQQPFKRCADTAHGPQCTPAALHGVMADGQAAFKRCVFVFGNCENDPGRAAGKENLSRACHASTNSRAVLVVRTVDHQNLLAQPGGLAGLL